MLAVLVTRIAAEEQIVLIDDESDVVKRSAEPIFFGKGGGRGGGHRGGGGYGGGGHGGGHGGRGGGYGHGKRSVDAEEPEEITEDVLNVEKRSAEPIFFGKGGGRGGGHRGGYGGGGHGGGHGGRGGGYGHGKRSIEDSETEELIEDESNLVKRSAEPIFFGKGGGRGGGHGGGYGGGHGGRGGGFVGGKGGQQARV